MLSYRRGLVGLGSGVIPGYKRERAMIGKAIARSIPPITARISAHTQIAPNATNARKINNKSMLESFLLLSDVSRQLTPTEFFISYISHWIFTINIFKILFAINNDL